MPVLFVNIAAIILYGIASIYCAMLLKQRVVHGKSLKTLTEQVAIVEPSIIQPMLLKMITLATALHGIGAYGIIVKSEGLALGFFNVPSLIIWCINLIVLISGLYKPLYNLWILLLPLSIIIVAVSLVGHSPVWHHVTFGIGVHILFSILAYSLFTIAILQAMLLGWQNHQLKNHRSTGFMRLMPPIETMETLLFEFVWVGQLLLTLGIITGVVYIDDIFAQHLAHKTVLSIMSWLIFSGLLLGRHWMGWRGNTAIRWIVSGFCMLMLGFFGSKLVLEIILKH